MYQPRNDFVLLQLRYVGSTVTGIHIPQRSNDGKEWFVVKAGPEVKDLQPGDQIVLAGTEGEFVVRLPRERDLFVVKQTAIIAVCAPRGAEGRPPEFEEDSQREAQEQTSISA